MLIKISEDEIRQIVADKYGVHKDMVTAYADYRFVKKHDNVVKEKYIFCIVDDNKIDKIAEQLNSCRECKSRIYAGRNEDLCELTDNRMSIYDWIYDNAFPKWCPLKIKNETEQICKD